MAREQRKKTSDAGASETKSSAGESASQATQSHHSDAWSAQDGTTSSASAGAGASQHTGPAVAAPASPTFQQTFDSGLYQGLRIMVPIDVQAYVVDSQSGRQEKPITKSLEDSMDIHESSSNAQSNATPLAQPEGIHLHWTMPDALMIGEEKEGLDQEVELKLKESHDFSPLPDRWVVVRQWPDGPNDSAWKCKAWLVNSNDKSVSELDRWTSPGISDSLMTAVDDGDPNTEEDITWTATYDASHGRFTFHDLPEAGVTGPLNYLVAGWYSTNSQDPLSGSSTRTRGEWKNVMERLGWSVPETEILSVVAKAESEANFTGTGGGDS